MQQHQYTVHVIGRALGCLVHKTGIAPAVQQMNPCLGPASLHPAPPPTAHWTPLCPFSTGARSPPPVPLLTSLPHRPTHLPHCAHFMLYSLPLAPPPPPARAPALTCPIVPILAQAQERFCRGVGLRRPAAAALEVIGHHQVTKLQVLVCGTGVWRVCGGCVKGWVQAGGVHGRRDSQSRPAALDTQFARSTS
jgi:hypothetical protein